MRQPITPMMVELNSDTVAHPAVIETHPASKPAPAVIKLNRFVSSVFVNHAVKGLKMIVAMQLDAPETVVATMT